jgi:hypothetical protein
MEKSRSLAILMLGLASLILIACQTAGTPTQSAGTPTQSDGTPTQSRVTTAPQAPPPADSANHHRTTSYSGDVKSVTSAQLKDLKGEQVKRLGNLSSAVMGQAIKRMRAILYAALAVIFIVVIGAITAERVGRHRKLTPASFNARH